MRAGQNPAKFIEETSVETERVTVAILTHIPYLQGYYEQSLEVLKACLDSLEKNTSIGYDLLIFDNASGVETRSYLHELHDSGRIEYLFLARENLGKGRAWDVIFSAAPGEIIAYADSDVYFQPGWLQNGIEILETFPKVGMVTCRPMRTYAQGHTTTLEWGHAERGAELSAGSFMDWETFREHDVSLGQSEEDVRARYESSEDVLIGYQGINAYAGAAHWQFLAYKHVLNEFIPLGIERPLGDDRKLDDALNRAGYLRLMTTEPLVRHLGNTLPEGLLEEGVIVNGKAGGERSKSRRMLDWPPIRRVLMAIYNRIFRWYFYR
jgi:glycosyltransferase involved in cell wall biosynthesis